MFESIPEAARALRSRQISCLELVDESLRRIRTADIDLNAFLTVTEQPARDLARSLDRELAEGHDRGILHGIPVAYKDIFFTRGIRTTNGSKLFSDFIPDYSATVVTRLEDAGAVSVGKLNQHELAYGITSTNPHFGEVRNPHGRDHIPGGSSGGSGAALAANMVYATLGTDTGGSIRIPSSFCGVTGFKPTFGRVSRYGTFALGLTLDHVGPMARSVADAAYVWEAIAGHDALDESTDARPISPYTAHDDLRNIRIGVPSNYYLERIDDDVRAAFNATCNALQNAGAILEDVFVPDPAALTTLARIVLLSEASAMMAPYFPERRNEFGDDVLALLDWGRLIPATDYIQAQRLRRVLEKEWSALLRKVDLVITPTAPIPAPKIGQTSVEWGGQQEETRMAATRFVRGISALGLPALSLPAGATSAGLPLGLQVIGRAYEDEKTLGLAAGIEAVLRAGL